MTDAAARTLAVPPPLPRARPRVFWWISSLVVVGAVVVYAFDPATHQLLPPCPLHALTGLYCPGCGATRAAHQLLHGHVAAAFNLNPLVFVAVPVVLFLWCRRLACGSWQGARGTFWALLVLTIA